MDGVFNFDWLCPVSDKDFVITFGLGQWFLRMNVRGG